jgi:exonuclease SbcD
MKILFFSDAHIRGDNPRSRKDNYPQALENKFNQIREIIQDRDVKLVLNGGDLFNSPAPSYSVVSHFASLLRSWKIPIYSIIGSHDKF